MHPDSDIDALARTIRATVLTGYFLVPWPHLPPRHRAKWREAAHVALDGGDIARIHDAATAGKGAPWAERRACERARWEDAWPRIRAAVAQHRPRPNGRTVTLRERLAARWAG